MALFAAALSQITPCVASYTAYRACKAAVRQRGRERHRRGRGIRKERTKHYLSDSSRDSLSGVNYQQHEEEVASVDMGGGVMM